MRLRVVAAVDSTMFAYLLGKLNKPVPRFKGWDLPTFFSASEIRSLQASNFKQAVDKLKPYCLASLTKRLKASELSSEEFQVFVRENPDLGSLSSLERDYVAKGVLQDDDLLTTYVAREIGPTTWKTYLFQYIRNKDLQAAQTQPVVAQWLELIKSQKHEQQSRFAYDNFEALQAGLQALISSI